MIHEISVVCNYENDVSENIMLDLQNDISSVINRFLFYVYKSSFGYKKKVKSLQLYIDDDNINVEYFYTSQININNNKYVDKIIISCKNKSILNNWKTYRECSPDISFSYSTNFHYQFNSQIDDKNGIIIYKRNDKSIQHKLSESLKKNWNIIDLGEL
jgi:hypothetical protein